MSEAPVTQFWFTCSGCGREFLIPDGRPEPKPGETILCPKCAKSHKLTWSGRYDD
jgi:DNA-directed RNA polymerase subunit RPC12/RpoP